MNTANVMGWETFREFHDCYLHTDAWTASGSSSCVLGARVWRLHRAYRFACSPFMAGFMELKHSERRQLKTAGSVVAEKVVKLTQNAIFGRCCMNPDKFRNTNAYVDPAKFERPWARAP